jgi:hypothetical protein
MKTFVLLLIILPTLAFSYESKDVNLSDFGFNRYVRPQLINITQEYQTLLSLLTPELKTYQNINRVFTNLDQDIIRIKEYYKFKQWDQLSAKVATSLDRFRSIIKTVKKAPYFTEHKNFSPEDILISFKEFQSFKSVLMDLYLRYENIHTLIQAKIILPINITQLQFELNNVYTKFNLFILQSSDNRFREELISFWNDFIKPVHKKILPTNNKVLFIRMLNKFNLRLNFLNAKMTKRNKMISKQMSTILTIIHRRWNSILKVTLKRY